MKVRFFFGGEIPEEAPMYSSIDMGVSEDGALRLSSEEDGDQEVDLQLLIDLFPYIVSVEIIT